MTHIRRPLTVSTLLAASLFAGAAFAGDLITQTPAVHLTAQSGNSQAQLAEALKAQGYSGIILSSSPALPNDPHPERNPSLTDHPEKTPVRIGWNGVAVKDGQTVQVYADN